MNIGAASKASGVSIKMIRHYESLGLVPRVTRRDSGYRDFGDADVARLAFIRRARAAGFSTAGIRELLSLWAGRRPARDVRRLAERHLHELDARIGELRAIAETLAHLVEHCRGDDRPECPILDALASGADHEHRHGAAARREAPRRTGRRGPAPRNR